MVWWAFAGCFHAGLHVRGGDLVGPGSVALEADGAPLTVAPATVEVRGEDVTATFGARQMLHPIFALFVPAYSVGLGARVGLLPGLEATANVGALELTGGLRTRLAHRVALSASGGAYPTVFPPRWNPRGTLTVDASAGAARLSLGASVGQQTYVAPAPERLTRPCGSFGQAGCGEYSPMASIEASRPELRVVGGLGFEVPVRGDPDEVAGVTVALAPWLVAAPLGPADLRVTAPARGPARDLRAAFGGSLVVGLRWGPWGPRERVAEDPGPPPGPPSGEGLWTTVSGDGTDTGSWRGGKEDGPFVWVAGDGSRWERSYRRGRLHGLAARWEQGALVEIGRYRHGHQRGWWSGWYPSGAPRYRGVFTASQTGPWTSWDESGAVTFHRP